jgi:hypothetical protein
MVCGGDVGIGVLFLTSILQGVLFKKQKQKTATSLLAPVLPGWQELGAWKDQAGREVTVPPLDGLGAGNRGATRAEYPSPRYRAALCGQLGSQG